MPREPVGDITVLQAGLGDDGTFGIETPEIFVSGAANPIVGTDLTAALVIQGQAFDRELGCGEMPDPVLAVALIDAARMQARRRLLDCRSTCAGIAITDRATSKTVAAGAPLAAAVVVAASWCCSGCSGSSAGPAS